MEVSVDTAADALKRFLEMVPEIAVDGNFVCDVYISGQGLYIPFVCLRHQFVSGAVPPKHVYVIAQSDRFRIHMEGIFVVVGLVFPTRCLPWSVPYNLVDSTISGIWRRWLNLHAEDAW